MSREKWEHFRDDTEWLIELATLWQLQEQTAYLQDIHAFHWAQQAEAERIQQLPRCPDCAVPLELGVRTCRACRVKLIWLEVDSQVLLISTETKEEDLAEISENKNIAFHYAMDSFIRVCRHALPQLHGKLYLFQTQVIRDFGTLGEGDKAAILFRDTENMIIELSNQIEAEKRRHANGFLGAINMFLGGFVFSIIPVVVLAVTLPSFREAAINKSFLPFAFSSLVFISLLLGVYLGLRYTPSVMCPLVSNKRRLKAQIRQHQLRLRPNDAEFLHSTRHAFDALGNLRRAFQEVVRRWHSHIYVVECGLENDVALKASHFPQASMVLPTSPFDPNALDLLVQFGHSFGIEWSNRAREQDLKRLPDKSTNAPSGIKGQSQQSQMLNHSGRLLGEQSERVAPSKLKALCPECATTFTLTDKLIGKKVKCKNCSRTFEIPRRGSSSSESTSIVIACPTCDASLRITGSLLGKLIRCAKCSNNFRTPG